MSKTPRQRKSNRAENFPAEQKNIPIAIPPRRRFKTAWRAGALIALLLLVIAGGLWWRREHRIAPAAPGQWTIFLGHFAVPQGDVIRTQAFAALAQKLRVLNLRVQLRTCAKAFSPQSAASGADADFARQVNATALLGLQAAATAKQPQQIVLDLFPPLSTKQHPRPDLQRLTASLIYPQTLTFPYAPETSWTYAADLLHAHVLMASALGVGIEPVLNTALAEPLASEDQAPLNFAAGSLALASAVGANGGRPALDYAIRFLTSARDEWARLHDANHGTQATLNLASALLLRQAPGDAPNATAMLDGLKNTSASHPDPATRTLAAYLRAQTTLIALHADEPKPAPVIESVISLLQDAEHEWTREKAPYAWAAAELLKARAWSRLSEAGDARAVESGIQAATNALAVYTRNPYPGEWAAGQSLLGLLYSRRASGTPEENGRLALDSYNQALEVWTLESTPVQWARDLENRATVHLSLPSTRPEESTRQSIADLQQAQRVFTLERDPVGWASLENTLGVAWHQMPRTRENMQNAIDCYKKTLAVRQPEKMPVDSAHTLANLGNAYRDFPASNPAEQQRYLNLALKAYDTADGALQYSLNRQFASRIQEERQRAALALKQLNPAAATSAPASAQ